MPHSERKRSPRRDCNLDDSEIVERGGGINCCLGNKRSVGWMERDYWNMTMSWCHHRHINNNLSSILQDLERISTYYNVMSSNVISCNSFQSAFFFVERSDAPQSSFKNYQMSPGGWEWVRRCRDDTDTLWAVFWSPIGCIQMIEIRSHYIRLCYAIAIITQCS